MKSVLTKKSVKQIWLIYVIVGYSMAAAGVYVISVIGSKRGPIYYATFGLLMMLYGLVLINQAALVRGQSEIKKSINDLKEKIDELGKRK